jgi:hypothetical protein
MTEHFSQEREELRRAVAADVRLALELDRKHSLRRWAARLTDGLFALGAIAGAAYAVYELLKPEPKPKGAGQ